MEQEYELAAHMAKLFAEQLFAVLSTTGETGPHSSIVSFVSADDLKSLIFSTPRQTRKYRNLTANPSVSLLIDNRSNRIVDLEQVTAVEARGNAEEVDPDKRYIYKELFEEKYPDMSDFIHSPGNALIRIAVKRFDIVRHFQNVTVLEIQ
mgnify:FL=1